MLMTNGAERLLANIRELATAITSRAAEIEAGRRMPPDLVQALRSIGLFRIFVPQSHGGLELDMPTALEILGALSRIDGSVGWTAMIGGGCDLFAPLLPRDTYEQVYQNGPDVIIAGSAPPTRTAEGGAGGWGGHGRCALVRGVFLPARDWQIEDTWYVAGLKGTGSDHIALKDTVVSEANFFDLANGVPCLPGPLYQAVPQLLPLMHGASSVGMAEGALDELVELANTGRQQ